MCTAIPTWGTEEVPVIGGKVGGTYEGEEISKIERLREKIETCLCSGHTIDIAVLCEDGDKEFLTFTGDTKCT